MQPSKGNGKVYRGETYMADVLYTITRHGRDWVAELVCTAGQPTFGVYDYLILHGNDNLKARLHVYKGVAGSGNWTTHATDL